MDEKLADLKRRLDADPDNISLLREYVGLKSRIDEKEELIKLVEELVTLINQKEGMKYELRKRSIGIIPTKYGGNQVPDTDFRVPERRDRSWLWNHPEYINPLPEWLRR